MIQNMSCFVCPHCEHTTHIFGKDGVAATAEAMGIPLLGEIPLELAIREHSDAGTPTVVAQPASAAALAYAAITDKLLDRLQLKD